MQLLCTFHEMLHFKLPVIFFLSNSILIEPPIYVYFLPQPPPFYINLPLVYFTPLTAVQPFNSLLIYPPIHRQFTSCQFNPFQSPPPRNLQFTPLQFTPPTPVHAEINAFLHFADYVLFRIECPWIIIDYNVIIRKKSSNSQINQLKAVKKAV